MLMLRTGSLKDYIEEHHSPILTYNHCRTSKLENEPSEEIILYPSVSQNHPYVMTSFKEIVRLTNLQTAT